MLSLTAKAFRARTLALFVLFLCDDDSRVKFVHDLHCGRVNNLPLMLLVASLVYSYN